MMMSKNNLNLHLKLKKRLHLWSIHCVLGGLVSLFIAESIHAQRVVSAWMSRDSAPSSKYVDIEIGPAKHSIPKLKNRLFPSPSSLTRGDGVTYYHRAIAALKRFDLGKSVRENRILRQDRRPVPIRQQTIGELWDYADKRLSPSELKQIRSVIFGPPGTIIFRELKTASSFSDCDWGFDTVREKPLEEYVVVLLPDLQDVRQLSVFLSLKAKIEIAEGRYDDATETLRVGFSMSKSVENVPFLVSSLVGVASANIMLDRLSELISQPDAPCYYWPLKVLPSPIIDVRKAIVSELEYFADGAGIGIFKNPETARMSTEHWRDEFNDAMQSVFAFQRDGLLAESQGLRPTLIAMRAYPIAKRDLKSWGLEEGKVDAMAVGQVLAIHEKRMLRRIGDEFLKLQNLDYNEFSAEYSKVWSRMSAGETDPKSLRELIPVGSVLIPAMDAVLMNERRTQNKIRVLQVLAAIRLHVAEHGSLPDRLDEIKAVKIPRSLVTGKPFVYKKSGAGFELWETVESDPYFYNAKIYRLNLSSAKK